jgi:AcrR family transcriptional regulator
MVSMASSDHGPDGLPRSVARAWGLAGRAARGPRPSLSVEAVVAAGVAVADRDGLDAVSMARVAEQVGASTMALYRYVEGKQELLALMADAALGLPPSITVEEGGWRQGLERWAWAYREAALLHPWALRLPIEGPPLTPNLVGWVETALRCLSDTALREEQKMSVLLLLSGYVRNEATLAVDLAAGSGAGQELMPSWAAMLRELTDPQAFPALHAVLASDALARDDPPEHEFRFGLERVLDGIAVLVGAQSSAR